MSVDKEFQVTIPFRKFPWYTVNVNADNAENAKKIGLHNAFNNGYRCTEEYKNVQVIEVK